MDTLQYTILAIDTGYITILAIDTASITMAITFNEQGQCLIGIPPYLLRQVLTGPRGGSTGSLYLAYFSSRVPDPKEEKPFYTIVLESWYQDIKEIARFRDYVDILVLLKRLVKGWVAEILIKRRGM